MGQFSFAIDTQGQNIGRIPDIFPGIFDFQILIGKEIIYIFQFDATGIYHFTDGRNIHHQRIIIFFIVGRHFHQSNFFSPVSHFIQGKKGGHLRTVEVQCFHQFIVQLLKSLLTVNSYFTPKIITVWFTDLKSVVHIIKFL